MGFFPGIRKIDLLTTFLFIYCSSSYPNIMLLQHLTYCHFVIFADVVYMDDVDSPCYIPLFLLAKLGR